MLLRADLHRRELNEAVPQSPLDDAEAPRSERRCCAVLGASIAADVVADNDGAGEDGAFRAGDVLQVPASPVKCARCLPPADAVEGDLALPAGEFVKCGGGAWYATAEGESCEAVARKFYGAAGDEGVGVYAANRHREALWNLSPRGPLARWTVLFVPRAADFREEVLERRRSKACAACVC